MGILGIKNRTENWKTAALFSPLLGANSVRLAHLLGEGWQTEPQKVRIELFWKGMRDYIYGQPKESKPNPSKIVCAYSVVFPSLRDEIENFNKSQVGNRLALPNPSLNYDVSDPEKLYSNMENTEIDIVLEAPNHLYIGEAKQQSNLGANGDLVLVHQLIRQYVMARVLCHLLYCENDNSLAKKRVVPFLVVDRDKRDSVMNTNQVIFMVGRKWLKAENVLTWDEIMGLHPVKL